MSDGMAGNVGDGFSIEPPFPNTEPVYQGVLTLDPTSETFLRWSPFLALPPQFQTLTANGAVTIDAAMGDVIVNLEANATSTTIVNSLYNEDQYPGYSPRPGQLLRVTFVQDATGGRTYAWPSNCAFGAGVTTTSPIVTVAAGAPTDTVALSQTSVLFRWDGTTWQEMSRAVSVG